MRKARLSGLISSAASLPDMVATCTTDIRNWKTNYNKSAGCTDAEIQGLESQMNPSPESGALFANSTSPLPHSSWLFPPRRPTQARARSWKSGGCRTPIWRDTTRTTRACSTVAQKASAGGWTHSSFVFRSVAVVLHSERRRLTPWLHVRPRPGVGAFRTQGAAVRDPRRNL